jgi:ribosome-associated heat shock protein Hsp15
MEKNIESIRLDKWLWAARFFKTRSQASQAVNGGKVHLNGNRIKAARTVTIGDNLEITRGVVEFSVKVLGTSKYRRPAVEAQLLYEESEESIEKREKNRMMRKMNRAGYSAPAKRPGKRDRRKIKSFTRKD